MKYIDNTKAAPDVRDKSKREIESVNKWIDDLRGVVIGIQHIHGGQPRPYADSIYESVIFLHQPNALTTGAPLTRSITEAEARALARIFVRGWSDDPQFLQPYLEFIRPEPNPCGLEDYGATKRPGDPVRSCCWRVRVVEPYCD